MKVVRGVMRWTLPSVVSVVLTLLVWTYLAQASHNFTDVPDSLGVFHSAVEWMKNRQITGGCTTTEYCPNSPVTRAQMALFMQRLGGVLTPTGPVGNLIFGPIDIDTGPGPGPGALVCMTTPVASATYPRNAFLFARVSILGPPLSYRIATIVSTDGGANWAYTDPFVPSVASTSNDFAHTNYTSGYDLDTGTTYLFAIEVGRAGGAADPTSGGCNLQVGVFNRNPTTSPLKPAPVTREQKWQWP